VYVIGLTGGIAAGKSTVTKRLGELGAVTIDADQLAREAVAPGSPGFAAIRSRFGEGVVGPDGALDRPALGAIVFSDESARLDLNGITHPAVSELFQERLRAAEDADPSAIVVYDVPLMAETGGRRGGMFEFVIVVEAPVEQRIRRLVELRGMDRADAERRIAAQAGDAERRVLADVVIDSGGSLEHTLEQVDAAWGVARQLATAKHGAGAPDATPSTGAPDATPSTGASDATPSTPGPSTP
jgi:dephospho-CoA kinase